MSDDRQLGVGSDPVDHPSHYTGHPSGVECITITEHYPFNVGNAIKYIVRHREKGNPSQDLAKARWYVQRELERITREEWATFPEEALAIRSSAGPDRTVAADFGVSRATVQRVRSGASWFDPRTELARLVDAWCDAEPDDAVAEMVRLASTATADDLRALLPLIDATIGRVEVTL